MIDHHQRIAIKFLIVILLCLEFNTLFVAAGGDGEVRCREKEREALLRFKKSLKDDYGWLSSWGSEEDKKECCKWRGVGCSNTTGHVTDLEVDYWQGEISPALLELPYLINLDLSRRNFGDNTIPEFIGSMKRLENLKLSSSGFSGTIPPQLGNLTNLRNLDLSENMLRGEIPKSFRNLSRLQTLILSKNQLEGDFDKWLFWSSSTTRLVSLQSLYLSDNQLKGSVPASLAQLSRLVLLDLSFNSLEGTISESHFVKLHNLKVLDLSFNSFTMQIAPDWSPPFQLNLINLASCKIGPRFPEWIQTQSNFSYLDLSGAALSDKLPKWFWNSFSSLEYLNISNNQISGTIPDLSSSFIRIMDVSYNKFSGSIPLLHPGIEMLQLSQNMFSGPISSVCAFSTANLVLLDLSNNRLSGELPSCWEKASVLMFLNLANNSFSGEIPSSLGSLRDLIALYLRDNNLSGELPSNLKNCQNLRLFDIGENNITGNIPAWIGASYPEMAYLSFRHNKLYGSIPPEICNLTRMQILDLSENKFSGIIPECFSNFTSMVEKNTTTIPSIAVNIDVTMYTRIPGVDIVKMYIANGFIQWKRQDSEYRNTLLLLKLIDLSSNRLG